MGRLYPGIEPYEHGMLDVGDGNAVYWEACGNPEGRAAVVFHGGPGSGCTPGFRRYFDPGAYRIVLFDQRGCGRSTPHASDPATDLSVNTSEHLLRDAELLREKLDIRRWLVFGGSWGTTLGLAYAERHPERVTALVLTGIALTTSEDVEWLTRGLGRFFPEQWARFRDGVPAAERDGNLAVAYARLLADPDPAVREQAARGWCDYEDAIVMLHADDQPDPRYEDSRFRMAWARIVTHYFSNHGWLEDGIILEEANRLAGIPGVMVHGRLDLTSPLRSAWALARAWPEGELVVVDGAGHLSSEANMTARLVDATDGFASLD